MRANDAPLKVTPATKDLVRYGAMIFACTQGEFVERAISGYLSEQAEEIERRVSEQQAQAEQIASKFK